VALGKFHGERDILPTSLDIVIGTGHGRAIWMDKDNLLRFILVRAV